MADITSTFSATGVAENVANRVENTYSSSLATFQAISVFLTLFFITSSIFFIITTGWLELHTERIKKVLLNVSTQKKRVIKGWKRVKLHLAQGDENSLKIALIEADKILDETLKLTGYPGPTLGDRLKAVKTDELPNIDELWQAHKLRNRLVHEPDFKLDRSLAERALAIYQEAFERLGLLQ